VRILPIEFQNRSIVNTRFESRAELIKHLSHLERERQEPITLDCPKEELPIPAVIYLGLRTINVSCIDAVPYAYERLAVDFCPINSIPTCLEW
jgi:hypothetical protein